MYNVYRTVYTVFSNSVCKLNWKLDAVEAAYVDGDIQCTVLKTREGPIYSKRTEYDIF